MDIKDTFKVRLGPEAALDNVRYDVPLDCSFRVLSDYHPPTDGQITRLDVLVGGNQFNVVIAGNPDAGNDELGSGRPIRDGKNLFLPPHLAKRGWATVSRVNAAELASALHGLAKMIEAGVQNFVLRDINSGEVIGEEEFQRRVKDANG